MSPAEYAAAPMQQGPELRAQARGVTDGVFARVSKILRARISWDPAAIGGETARATPQHRSGGAGHLAWRALRLCRAGLLLRDAGRCIAGDGDERAHGRNGHDVGCTSLGVSLASFERALARWDRVGARLLISEAIAAAAETIAGDPDRTASITPLEAVAFELERRIGPVPAPFATELPRRGNRHSVKRSYARGAPGS